ncbi:MAG: ATP cone domain-containing protein, partial [Pseudomonas sp.]
MHSTLIRVGNNQLYKRDGSLVAFDADKIRQALIAAGKATGEYAEVEVDGLLAAVLAHLENFAQLHVEQVQDRVERVLMDAGYF